MSEDMHFGYAKNHHICSCGKHYGCGEWTPEQRAAFAKRVIERLPEYARPEQRAFAADWERWHGPINYTMGIVDTITEKNKKSRDIRGPIFVANERVSA